MSDQMDAGGGFLTDQPMYKNSDFRCLKPISGVKSSKWPHYEMKGFRAAKSDEELSKVAEVPFDKFFVLVLEMFLGKVVDFGHNPRSGSVPCERNLSLHYNIELTGE